MRQTPDTSVENLIPSFHFDVKSLNYLRTLSYVFVFFFVAFDLYLQVHLRLLGSIGREFQPATE